MSSEVFDVRVSSNSEQRYDRSVVATPETALDAVADAFRALHVGRVRRGRQSVRVEFDGGHEVEVGVHATHTVRAGAAVRLAGGSPLIVVADRVPASQRAELDRAGVGWLDRRGHLRFRHGPVLIDADVPADVRSAPSGRRSPLGGPVALGVAFAALLAHPQPVGPVREVARRLGASPAGVSTAATRLVDAGLLTRDRRAAVPGLFWAVAEAWDPRWLDLTEVPEPDRTLCSVGTRAAMALGAPVASRGRIIELIATDERTLRRLTRTPPDGKVAARIAMAPTSTSFDPGAASVEGHPTAPTVIVAASIASDPARGAEIVERWDLPDRAW